MEDPRYIEEGNNVFFPKAGLNFHKLFIKRFVRADIISARTKLKHCFSHSQKDDIIHYLKEKGVIKKRQY